MANRKKSKPIDDDKPLTSAEVESFLRMARKVPKVCYEKLSGRQTKVLHDQAERYQFPLRGSVIDLFAVLKRFHDFIADNKYKFVDDDPDVAGPSSPALEELRRVKVEQERIKLASMESRFVDRALVREFLGQLATHIRQTSDRAESLFGRDGRELINQMLDAVDGTIDKFKVEGEPEAEVDGDE